MRAYHPCPDRRDDYGSIRQNGMWHQHWQSGYHDILKRGFPRPKYKTTILAELHSPYTPDFLHGGARDVPFLVSPRVKAIIREHGLTGIRFSRVEVAKIATKGRRKRRSRGGEPEDQIMKAQNRLPDVRPPKLHAVYVIGRLEIIPDYPSGRCPDSNYVTPFELPREADMPDLWRPTINGQTCATWKYCSQRFRDIVTAHSLSNISFEPFDEHMACFRKRIEPKRREST